MLAQSVPFLLRVRGVPPPPLSTHLRAPLMILRLRIPSHPPPPLLLLLLQAGLSFDVLPTIKRGVSSAGTLVAKSTYVAQVNVSSAGGIALAPPSGQAPLSESCPAVKGT